MMAGHRFHSCSHAKLLALLLASTPAAVAEPDKAERESLNEIVDSDIKPGSITIVDGDDTYEVPYSVSTDGDVVVEGDMIIGSFSEIRALEKRPTMQSVGDLDLLGIFTTKRRPWPKGIVYYRIEKGLPNQARLHEAMKHWEMKTKIRFQRAKSTQGAYVRFIYVSGADCSADVGYRGKKQRIKVSNSCTTGNIIHEIGHTLGLGHEQMREDQETYVTVIKSNILRDDWKNFESKPYAYIDVGTYCYESIMHYGRYQYAIDPSKPTLVPKKAGARIGQRNGLMDCDTQVIDAFYANEFAKR